MHLILKNARKGRWVISPDNCASHPWHFCAVGDNSCLKIWRPSGLTLRHIHMTGVRWGTRCKGFLHEEYLQYCFEQKVRNPLECDQVRIALGSHPEAVIWQATINLIHKFGNPLGISFPSSTAILSRAYAMQESWAWGHLWVEKVWFELAWWTFAPETFSKRRKGERKPVLSLLPGFLKHLASRNPRVLCQKHGGARMTYYLGGPKVHKNGMRNWIPVQSRKEQRN
jgi:hypothetical protein